MTVHVVAAGPGDPGLLTVRAERLLAGAGAVVHDGAVPAAMLALVGPDAVVEEAARDTAGPRLVELAATHADVVRLTAGDGALWSAGGPEAATVRAAGVPVTVEPGVAAAFAEPAHRGIPVMARDRVAGLTVAVGVEPPAGAAASVVVAGDGVVTVHGAVSSAVSGAASDPSDRAPAAPPATTEPELDPEVAAATKGLRTGWTTGTCASAAAKAAAIGLLTGTTPAEVEVGLPGGARVRFPVESDAGTPWRAVVVKDAGDDPDCTDGAHLTATVGWREGAEGADPGVAASVLRNGSGVGTVTMPGLGLPVGAPAINPVPRRMILAALAEVTDRALDVEISVPGGEAMATKTSNDRLGIVGGISILGTTGIVKPFSTASYRASVVQQIDVARAQGVPLLVLATGTRSDRAAQDLYRDLPPVAFVEVGDFTGIALRHAAQVGFERVAWVGMAGKITKLAAGVMMTHFRRTKVDTDLLAEVARAAGASDEVVRAATETATARHFCETCIAAGALEPLAELCRRAARAATAHTGGALAVEVVMVDFEGVSELARG